MEGRTSSSTTLVLAKELDTSSVKVATVWAIGLGSLVAATVAAWDAVWQEEALPGEPVGRQQLDALWAGACGQFCSQTGNLPCTGNTVCLTNPDGSCSEPGVNCAACSGLAHNTCRNGGNPNDLCYEYTQRCCKGGASCRYTATGCRCVGVPPSIPSGLLIWCGTVTGGCGSPPPPGGGEAR